MFKYTLIFIVFAIPALCRGGIIKDPMRYVIKNSEFAKQNGTTKFYLDINHDKKPDLFAGEKWSGNAGGNYFVFLKTSVDHKLLGTIFIHPEGFELLKSKHHGMRDILNYRRSGGSDAELITFQYNGQKYAETSRKRVKPQAFGVEIRPTVVKSIDGKP